MGKSVLMILPEQLRQDALPLVTAYQSNDIRAEICLFTDDTQFAGMLQLLHRNAAGYDAVLVAGAYRRAPSTVLPGPFIETGKKRVPAGWLPVRDRDSFVKAITTAAHVQTRKKERIGVAVLAQRHPRFLSVATRVQSSLERSRDISVFKWSSDLLIKEEMVRGLGCGLGCAMYLGHGRPIGWVGYYGTRIHDFLPFSGKPLGVLCSLCCLTASRKRTGISFAENIVLNGIAASVFASVNKSKHLDNTRWAIRMCDSLKNGAGTLADLVLDACPPEKSAWSGYRILGDPLASLHSVRGACSKADTIEVCE